MAAQLYGVSFWDPFALTIAAGSLAACTFFAAIIPAGMCCRNLADERAARRAVLILTGHKKYGLPLKYLLARFLQMHSGR